ncbi:MAB_1171c family putative transporter [Streptomyces griseofuscus]|uniref:MAB_1171c family putative transporter n=1 Tax=Streptomyces griseofuscus TaxID=146922 RepID=UPI00340F95D9
MKDILHPLCLIIAGLGFLILLRDLIRDRRNPALNALAWSFLASALSYAVSITWVWVRIDKFFGVPNIVVPIAQGFVIVVLALQSTVLAYWSRPAEQARRRGRHLLLAAAAVIAGMAVLFVLLTPNSQRPTDFSLYYAHDPAYQAYVLLYFGTYTVAEVYLTVACWKHARTAATRSIDIGLRLVSVGAAITLVYSAIRIGAVVGADTGFSVDRYNNLAWACGDLGATLTQIGYFLPVIAIHASAVYAFTGEHRAYARLDRLWTILVQVDPSVVLQEHHPQGEYLRRRESIHFPLIRRRTEIRDGQMSLRPYLSPAARHEAEAQRRREGLSGDKLAAAVTADQLRHALILHRQGKPVPEPAEYADGGLSLDTVKAEQKHLLRVASYFQPPPPETPFDLPTPSTTPGVRT